MAFCFYNLSSIINGLVYFDQFGLLSTAHLLLVILGIVILLAGVWIVSFPPGGTHRIDLSTWDESEEGSDSEGEYHEVYEDEPLPMAGSPADEEIGMGRVSISRERPVSQPPLLVDLSISPEGDHQTTRSTESPLDSSTRTSPISTRSAPHSRRQTDSALLSTQYGVAPPINRTRPSHPLQGSPTRPRHRPTLGPTHHATLGPLSPRQGYPSYTHPLSPGAPSGFSIGLSPVSPGFALVPTERLGRARRRVTSLSSVDGPADPFTFGAHARPGRRVISEGSQGNLAHAAEGEPGRQGDVEAGLQQSAAEGQQGEAQQSDAPRSAGGRWRWISGINAFRRR